jgi:hypothetical protein
LKTNKVKGSAMTKKTVTTTEDAPQGARAKTPATAAAKIKVLATESANATPASGKEKVKKPAFLDRALLRTDVKKRDAKPAIEAALAELSAALIAGEELVLPPLGKLKVVNSKDLPLGAKALTLKLRTMKTDVADDA